MPITPLGQINTTALEVADVYIQIVPPQYLLNGVPSNIGGLVGVASWGPVDEPQIFGSLAQFETIFGPLKSRTRDMGTWAAICFELGASAIKGVRVTDGTDVAASVVVQANCITFSSRYTGTHGNSARVYVGPGSKPNTHLVRVSMPGLLPEIFDNITGADNALWLAIASAVNTGIPGQRGPSQMITAAAGIGTAAPVTAAYSLVGGTDGVTGVVDADLLGADTLPRTGLYALRGQDVSAAALCDVTDHATWVAQATMGASEGVFIFAAGAPGQSIATARANKNGVGLDDWAIKVLLGDHVYWNDSYNRIPQRLVSPAPFALGKYLALSPQHSGLNKRLSNVISTQKSSTGLPYTYADIQELNLGGVDVICNPSPGGKYFALRSGRNASSSPATRGDNYTRMTNYIAATLNRGMGIYIGQLQSRQPKDETRRRAKATLDAFLTAMKQQGQIDDFQVVLDLTNNPPERIALGYMQADIQVVYLSVVEYFIINVEGGQTVEIKRVSLQQAA